MYHPHSSGFKQRLNGGLEHDPPVPQPSEHPVDAQHPRDTSNDVQVTPVVGAVGVGATGVGATGVGATGTGTGVGATGVGATGVGATGTGTGVGATGVGATGVGATGTGIGVGATGTGVGATGTGVGATGTGIGTGIGVGATGTGIGTGTGVGVGAATTLRCTPIPLGKRCNGLTYTPLIIMQTCFVMLELYMLQMQSL